MEILNVENLMFKYPKDNTWAIENVSFGLEEGSFTVLCGPTGSGKSTLLKLLKPEIAPLGEKNGSIRIHGNETEKNEKNTYITKVGYVCQNPKEQAVTDKVWHELAFGLENMHLSQNVMSVRVAEIASYFGIEEWFEKRVDELSGGQLQILNLASVLVMNPDILILDEPTAQLDPVSASELFMTLKKLNTDFSLTIIIAEHRLEELIPLCDNMLLMKDGKLIFSGDPYLGINRINPEDELFGAMPAAFRVYRKLNKSESAKSNNGLIPLTIRDGRKYVHSLITDLTIEEINRIKKNSKISRSNNEGEKPALEFKDVSFRYLRNLPDAIKNLNFKAYEGEVFCILGGNGSGKTTALNAAAGLIKPYEGTIKVFGKKISSYKNQSLYNKCLSMLSQDVRTLFLHNTVREELESRKLTDKLKDFPFDIKEFWDKHPYDLSGGEQQLLALAIVLGTQPRLLLLDEPTKGLDPYRKKKLISIIKDLKKTGVTIVAVTHDIEFAAGCADRCALFFKGSAVSCGSAENFFWENNYYTTAMCRMSRGICEAGVTVEEFTDSFSVFVRG